VWRSSSPMAILLAVLAAAQAARAADPAAPAPLLTKAGGVRCAVIMGRIAALEAPPYAAKSEATDSEAAGPRETLCIQASAGAYVVRYARIAEDEQLALDFLATGEVRIERRMGTTRVLFTQSKQGKLRLDVEEGGAKTLHEAPTLWHLLLAEPEAAREHLLPLLAVMNADWQLADQATAVRDALVAAAQEERPVGLSGTQVKRLVAELSAPKFSVRQASYRQLAEQGPAILPHLERLQRGELDAEQRVRLRELTAQFDYATADSPQRVAAWLRHDAAIWQALAKDKVEEVKRVAEEQLQRPK
jgi:hypothetical protein